MTTTTTTTTTTTWAVLGLAVVLAILWPSPTLACSCLRMGLNETMYASDESLFFRGTVVRDITPPPPVPDPNNPIFMMPNGRNQYVVQVGRVFKGCTIKQSERILVTSPMQSSMCGLSLAMGASYIFESGLAPKPVDAATLARLGNRTKVTSTVSVFLCGFNRPWDSVSEDDKNVLRAFPRKCDP
jgi:Tissue inhibitor of metalloproteinase